MKWAGFLERMEEIRNACKILNGKLGKDDITWNTQTWTVGEY
jgi:hypothetical protein